MCLPCSKCNNCGRFPPEGKCAFCGYLNPKGATKCEKCGVPFPPPPGGPRKKPAEK